MKMTYPHRKYFFLFITGLLFLTQFTNAQNLGQIFADEKLIEKDLWKKERLNYYIGSEDEFITTQGNYFRALEKIKNGLYEKAIPDLKKSIVDNEFSTFHSKHSEKGPTVSNANFLIGLCFQEIYQSDSALFFYQKVIDYDQYYLDAYIQTAFTLADLNKTKEASAFLEEASNIFPNSKKLNFAQALIYLNQNTIRKAKLYLNKAIVIDPSYEEANILLSRIYLYEFDIDKSMDILTKSINHSRKPLTALYFRASLYLYQRDTLKAYFDLNKAFQLDTIDNPVAFPLMMLDYHYKNYERANSIGFKLVNSPSFNENNSPQKSNYITYELKYLLNYINDSLVSINEQALFNSFFTCVANNDNRGVDNILLDIFKNNSPTLFEKRLSIFGDWSKNYIISITSLFQPDFVFETEQKNLKNKKISYTLDEYINQVTQYDSNIIDLYWVKGYLQLLKSKFDSAIITANKSIALDPTYVEPYKIIALSYFYKKNYAEAALYFGKLDSMNVEFLNSESFLAYTQIKSGNYEDAFETNIKVLENNEVSILPIYKQCLYFEMKNKPDSALKYYKILSEKEPLQSDYTRGMVRSYLSMNMTDKATETLLEASKRAYSDETLLVDLADLYMSGKKYEEAISVYKKILKKDKYYTYAYLGSADCYMNLNDYSNALEYYSQAISCNINYVKSYVGKAICLRKLYDYKGSNETALKITQLDNNQVEGYILMSENYFYLNQYAISISMGMKALQLDAGNKRALYQIAASTLAKGNIDYATELYKKIIETENNGEKSEAFISASETLKYMRTYNIQEAPAKEILVNVFHEVLN